MGSYEGRRSPPAGSRDATPGIPADTIRHRADREGNGQADDAGAAIDGRAADDLSGDLHAARAGAAEGAPEDRGPGSSNQGARDAVVGRRRCRGPGSAEGDVIEHGLKVENRQGVPQGAERQLAWIAPAEPSKDAPEKFQGQHPIRVVRLADGSVHREVLARSVDFSGPGQWIGLESEWYLTALIPKSAGMLLSEAKLSEPKADAAKPVDLSQVAVRIPLSDLKPGQIWEGEIQSYLGPKEHDRLKAVGSGLEKSIYFGGFPLPQAYGGLPMEWLAVPILWVMHRFYELTHNYGVAIILLTVITKVLFFPLTIKSMTSMKAMQSLQPQINALRSKYKSDPQRLQRETMELYRAHKVNPLGGCLPMVVQIPIFYALYVALSVSVEIQNAPFICCLLYTSPS